jgi:hypothetical protein
LVRKHPVVIVGTQNYRRLIFTNADNGQRFSIFIGVETAFAAGQVGEVAFAIAKQYLSYKGIVAFGSDSLL